MQAWNTTEAHRGEQRPACSHSMMEPRGSATKTVHCMRTSAPAASSHCAGWTSPRRLSAQMSVAELPQSQPPSRILAIADRK